MKISLSFTCIFIAATVISVNGFGRTTRHAVHTTRANRATMAMTRRFTTPRASPRTTPRITHPRRLPSPTRRMSIRATKRMTPAPMIRPQTTWLPPAPRIFQTARRPTNPPMTTSIVRVTTKVQPTTTKRPRTQPQFTQQVASTMQQNPIRHSRAYTERLTQISTLPSMPPVYTSKRPRSEKASPNHEISTKKKSSNSGGQLSITSSFFCLVLTMALLQ